MMKTLMRFFFL